MIAVAVAYLVMVGVRREPLRLGRFEIPVPSPRIAVAQLAVSALDWTFAAAVFYVHGVWADPLLKNRTQSALFVNGGTSRGGDRWIPDQEIRFQVSPSGS